MAPWAWVGLGGLVAAGARVGAATARPARHRTGAAGVSGRGPQGAGASLIAAAGGVLVGVVWLMTVRPAAAAGVVALLVGGAAVLAAGTLAGCRRAAA